MNEDNGGSNWLGQALGALPGVLDGTSKLIYAEKGISTAPVTYVQASGPAAGSTNNMLLYGGIAAVVLILVVVLIKN